MILNQLFWTTIRLLKYRERLYNELATDDQNDSQMLYRQVIKI